MVMIANDWGAKACRVLGLDVSKVRSLCIKAQAGEALVVNVELLPGTEVDEFLEYVVENLVLLTAMRPDGIGFEIKRLFDTVPVFADLEWVGDNRSKQELSDTAGEL